MAGPQTGPPRPRLPLPLGRGRGRRTLGVLARSLPSKMWPALVAYDLQEDGLYIARHILGDGWL